VESPLRQKPTAVVGASTGMFGAVWAQAEARKVLAAIGASVLDRELPIANVDEQFHPDGKLNDEDVEAALVEVLTELIDAVNEKAATAAA
jgi:chromate reductase